MGKKDSHHGFLKKFLYTYMAVLIIPLILLNVFVFRLVINHARVLDLKYTQEYLDRIKNDLEEEINRLELIAFDINESLLIRASVLDRDYNKISEAQRFLTSYTVANQFISDVIYYPRDSQILYGSGSVYSLNTYTKYFLALPGISPYDVYKKINAIEEPRMIKWTSSERGEKTLNFHYVYPLDKTTDRDSSLLFLISYASMSRLLGIDKTPPLTPLFLRDERGRIIYEYVPPGQEERVDSFLKNPSLFSRGKDKYTPITVKLSDPVWEISLLTEDKAFSASVKRAFTMTGLLSLAVLLLGVLIIRFALKLTYNPLRNLAETLTPEESVNDVLLSLQTGVLKLQSTQESALKKLQREDFIGTLLHLRLDDDSDQLLHNKAVASGFSSELSPMAAVVIDLGEQMLPGDSDLTDAYYVTLSDSLPLPVIGWYEPVAGRFICILQTKDRSKEDLSVIMEDVCDQLFEEFGIQGLVSLGSLKTDYSHLKDSMEEALLSKSTLSHEERRELSYLENKLPLLMDFIKEGRENQTEDLINELYSKSLSSELNSYHTFRLFNIITESLPEQSQDTWRKQRLPRLEMIDDRQKQAYIITLAKESIKILSHAEEQSVFKASLLEELDRYIDENYLRSDFSVSRTADHFNMSLSGISLLYKKYRGCGIAAYVGNARVDKARELLKKGCSVNEVVSRVGYSDSTSFIKKFKKITGQTPGEYLGELT
jgi:two-component system response regulator YesN